MVRVVITSYRRQISLLQLVIERLPSRHLAAQSCTGQTAHGAHNENRYRSNDDRGHRLPGVYDSTECVAKGDTSGYGRVVDGLAQEPRE
ncbi:MAG: hypothetical protein ACE5MI_00055 [Acidimicrobiia bacterium]